MSAIEFAKSRNCGALAALGIVRERGANQLGLRPALIRSQLPDSDREIRVQMNCRLGHLPYMVPYTICPLRNRRGSVLLATPNLGAARQPAVPEAIE